MVLKECANFANKNLFTNISIWTSGFRINEAATHTESTFGRFIRANTYGLGFSLGKFIDNHKYYFLIGPNIQKYTTINNEFSGPIYETNFTLGLNASFGVILTKKVRRRKINNTESIDESPSRELQNQHRINDGADDESDKEEEKEE